MILCQRPYPMTGLDPLRKLEGLSLNDSLGPKAEILRGRKNVVTAFGGLASPCVYLWSVVAPSIGR